MSQMFTGRRYIVFSLFLVLCIQLLPDVPVISTGQPILPLLIVAFWAYIVPSHIGSVFGFLYGLIIEAALGMGTLQLALPCALVALVTQHVFMKLRTYSVFQQSLYIACLALVAFVVVIPFSAVSLNLGLLHELTRTFIASAIVWFVLVVWFEPLSRRYVIAREQ